MSKLEIVWNTWQNIDAMYEKKGNGRSRLEFLREMLTPSMLTQSRQVVMSDFKETDENVTMLNILFKTLNDAEARLKNVVEEPDSLYQFIWESENEEKLIPLTFDDFNPLVRKYADEEELISKGIFRSVFSLGEDGTVTSEVVHQNLQRLIHFEKELDVVQWLNAKTPKIDSTNNFVDRVYLFLLDGIVHRKEIFPITLIDGSMLPDSYEITEEYNLTGTHSTLAHKSFTCKTAIKELAVSNGALKDRVVVCGRI